LLTVGYKYSFRGCSPGSKRIKRLLALLKQVFC
jgi:hypothetical protein